MTNFNLTMINSKANESITISPKEEHEATIAEKFKLIEYFGCFYFYTKWIMQSSKLPTAKIEEELEAKREIMESFIEKITPEKGNTKIENFIYSLFDPALSNDELKKETENKKSLIELLINIKVKNEIIHNTKCVNIVILILIMLNLLLNFILIYYRYKTTFCILYYVFELIIMIILIFPEYIKQCNYYFKIILIVILIIFSILDLSFYSCYIILEKDNFDLSNLILSLIIISKFILLVIQAYNYYIKMSKEEILIRIERLLK